MLAGALAATTVARAGVRIYQEQIRPLVDQRSQRIDFRVLEEPSTLSHRPPSDLLGKRLTIPTHSVHNHHNVLARNKLWSLVPY